MLLVCTTPAVANTAFYYASSPPIAELATHDRVVLDPRLVTNKEVAALRATGTAVHAYVSIGEIEPSDVLFSKVPDDAVLATNDAWNTKVVDLSHPAWRSLVLTNRIAPLEKRGFTGLFLDTLDSYQLTDAVATQQAALADLIEEIQTSHPNLDLLLNRGFEILQQLPKRVTGVVAESLYQSFNPATGEYREVPANDREWLLARFKEAQEFADEIIAIDYVPALDERALETAKKIKAHGFTPWVTDPSLRNLGVSTLVPIPRRIMLLHNDRGKKLAARDAHTLFGASLDWFGYVVDFHDINDGPPQLIKGVHRGLMMWLSPNETKSLNWFDPWLSAYIDGAPDQKLLLLGTLPTNNVAVLEKLNLSRHSFRGPQKATSVNSKSDLVGEYESPVRVRRYEIPNVRSEGETNVVHLSINLESNNSVEPVVTAPWGGVIHHPYMIEDYGDGQRRYVVNPFEFVRTALDHQPTPVIDTTTGNGRRFLTIHVDGDGFPSRAYLPGTPLSGNVLLDQFIANTDLPHTISIIEGEIGKAGLYPEQHEELESVARKIFKQPNVELASHSFSHPFFWQTAVLGSGDKQLYGLNLPIPGYTVDLRREIQGSVNYINRQLAPPDKRVKVFLWSGTADPDTEALQLVEEAGLVNVNGGNTVALHSTATTTNIWPQARRENGGMQIYAAIMNENVYTNDWTGPYYGYRKVIETFDITNAPKRLKPLCIYYHFYSTTKPASIKALREVYDAAIAERPFPVYLSEFAALVQGYYAAGLVKDLDGNWLLKNAGSSRTLRVPATMGYPASEQIAGYHDFNQDRYLHLTGPDATFQFTALPQQKLQLESANAHLDYWNPVSDESARLRLTGHVDVELSVHSTARCRLTANGKSLATAKPVDGIARFKLTTKDTGDALLVCK